MNAYKMTALDRTEKVAGNYYERVTAFYFTGETDHRHDSVAFDKGSDIPALKMSVKSSGFTLASGRVNHGETLEEKITDFTNRVASELFAYVTADCTAYVMNLEEFTKFLYTFCYLDRDSTKNGGLLKVKCRHESQKMVRWLEAQIA